MMIPISLKVTLDVVKYAYAKFIDWDMQMYDRDTQTYAEATKYVYLVSFLVTLTSTAISEDLGQIEFVFSDKTGNGFTATLTS